MNDASERVTRIIEVALQSGDSTGMAPCGIRRSLTAEANGWDECGRARCRECYTAKETGGDG